MHAATVLFLTVPALLMAGCAASPSPDPRLKNTSIAPYATSGADRDPDAPRPRAARCRGPSTMGHSASTDTMAVETSSDGGWCLRLTAWFMDTAETIRTPFDSLDLVTQPQHGTVMVHKLATATAIYYRATLGYQGNDELAFRRQPGGGLFVLDYTVVSR